MTKKDEATPVTVAEKQGNDQGKDVSVSANSGQDQLANNSITQSEEKASQGLEFKQLGVFADFAQQLAEKSWIQPTPIQQKSLPHALQGRDIAGFAQTGTGKTGVFLITLAQKLLKSQKKTSAGVALVICPTRELALQISEDAQSMLASLKVKTAVLYGGVSIEPQIKQVEEGAQLIVATPGRLLDLYRKQALDLKTVELFVCDEVDRMFDMGFIEDVEFILEKLDQSVQKLFFSATSNEKVKELVYEFLNEPKYISINMEEPTPDAMSQHAIMCEVENKFKILLSLLKKHDPSCAIVFTNTKLTASWLQYKLEKNDLNVDTITGDIQQNKRIALIRKIKSGEIKILIATDVASRGLHIANVTHVYNFDIPEDPANYVHRIGRTARAGSMGESYSLICEEYGQYFEPVQKLLGEKSPKPVWFDDSLLEVEDKAPNPFLDDFNKSSEKQLPRERERHSSRYQQKESRPSSGGRREPHRRVYDRERRSSQRSVRSRPDHRRSQKRQTSSAQPTFGSLVKRVFKVLFRR